MSNRLDYLLVNQFLMPLTSESFCIAAFDMILLWKIESRKCRMKVKFENKKGIEIKLDVWTFLFYYYFVEAALERGV